MDKPELMIERETKMREKRLSWVSISAVSFEIQCCEIQENLEHNFDGTRRATKRFSYSSPPEGVLKR